MQAQSLEEILVKQAANAFVPSPDVVTWVVSGKADAVQFPDST